VTSKLPASPDTLWTSESVSSSMFMCRPTSTSFGEIIHMAHSLVGKVLSSWAIVPPMAGEASTRYTKKPLDARSKAACIPAMPPPTTITAPTVSRFGSWFISDSQNGKIEFTHQIARLITEKCNEKQPLSRCPAWGQRWPEPWWTARVL